MGTVIRQRLVRLAIVMLLVTLGTSLMLELVPGSPAQLVAGEGATPDVIAQINREYGFDRPVLVRYVDWMRGLVVGDMGVSYRTREPVWHAISSRAPITFQLAIGAILLALLVAIPLALVCAYRAGSPFDRAVDSSTSVFIAVPAFLSALVLVYFISSQAGLLPVTGWVPFSEDPVGNLKHAAIPTIALALPAMSVFQRVLRADVIATLQQDHISLARAKGLSSPVIVLRHALRPSAFSLLTVAGIRLAELVGGTVIIESLFAIPGLGSLLVQSVLGRDMIMVQGIVVVIALSYLLINLLVDLSYRLLDPRVSI